MCLESKVPKPLGVLTGASAELMQRVGRVEEFNGRVRFRHSLQVTKWLRHAQKVLHSCILMDLGLSFSYIVVCQTNASNVSEYQVW